MNKPLDLESRWPELFAPLDAEQRRAIVRALAASWHDGWEPNREDVADLAEYVRGAITFDEYQERSAAKAERITEADKAKYAELAERAERGELRVKPDGISLRGDEAAAEGRRVLMEATGATDFEEVIQIALGRSVDGGR